jgi:translation initiation factor IF-3
MINEQIRDKEIRLVGENGEQLGIFSSRDAQRMADDKSLDLVKIAPAARPPVCKIMDYSKFRFEQNKREREARKKQKTIEVKELRLSPNIDEHDIQVKIRKAVEFLAAGDKVKVGVRFRYGREMSRTDVAFKILGDFARAVEKYGAVEKPPKMEGKTMAMFLTTVVQKIQVPKEDAQNA